jgi:hypothetical protein
MNGRSHLLVLPKSNPSCPKINVFSGCSPEDQISHTDRRIATLDFTFFVGRSLSSLCSIGQQELYYSFPWRTLLRLWLDHIYICSLHPLCLYMSQCHTRTIPQGIPIWVIFR